MKVTVLGNKEDIYIDSSNTSYVDITKAINYSPDAMSGANHAIIRRYPDTSFKIVQASGYSYDKGIFTNTY